ncbi:MAG: hypothetical protein Greene041662_316 [Candidatus Peregrinibacteria bacterium Greene0416_62]|nr:MAG: hypothetical protein Greene041662_316 [Candidatus Peregrinibacteria bacterium Greene0416_62]TSC98772.1 MAG: hypothetical protein Greene101449_841 [Candidatus Peregrinibacteria bacterium Greene1014_49]
MTIITTPSGFQAEVLIENAWGPEKKSAGLHYIDVASRKRLGDLFSNDRAIFDLRDISEDMRMYHFGYAENVPGIHTSSIQGTRRHIFPITSVPNCVWHADNLRIQHAESMDAIMDPTAVTMLYAQSLFESRLKETGFAHPQVIADAYNEFYDEPGQPPAAKGSAISLRAFADELGEGWDDLPKQPQKTAIIRGVLESTYAHIERVFQEQGIVGAYWLPHAKGRLVLFGNNDDIVHCNDLIKRGKNVTPRNQALWRRMLPGKAMMGFNS